MMRSLIALLLLTSAICVPGTSKAEYGCQDGFVPVFQGKNSTCVADYNLPYWQNRPTPNKQGPNVVWKDRFITLAWGIKRSGISLVVNAETQAKAERTALAECRRMGGIQCEIDSTMRNGCIAVAGWAPGYDVAVASTGRDREHAEENLLERCAARNNKSCEVQYSACATPIQKVSFW